MQDSLLHLVDILLSYVFSTNPIFYLENARREIAVGNVRKYQSYMNAVKAIIASFAVDEILNFMEGQ